jgi:hypothetical protein
MTDSRLLPFVRSLHVGRVYTADQIREVAEDHEVQHLDYGAVLKSVRAENMHRRYPGSCTLNIQKITDRETRDNWRSWVMAHIESSDDDE